jgi:cysteine desulfurase
MKIYLDNGSTTRVDDKVVKEMTVYLKDKYGNASSLHQFGREANDTLENSRSIIAQKINAEPDEIIFTPGGSESDNLAIKGIAYANKDKGNHIITSTIEHPAVTESCKALERDGFEITYLDVDSEGFIDIEQLKRSITDKTILVSIIHANNEIGTIQDMKVIGDICKQNNILLHSDAVQSFCKVPIDVKKTNIDLLSFSAHKIHGPKGIGLLFLKKGTKIQKLNHGGSQEHGIKAGTENIPAITGFAKAVEVYDKKDIDHMRKLSDRLMKELLDGVEATRLNGPKCKDRLCNNVNIVFEYIEGEAILMQLDLKGIAVSTGSACSSQSLKPSHVLMAIGLPHEIAHGSIRFTLSKYTTEKDIDYTVKTVKDIIKNLRELSPLRKGVKYVKEDHVHSDEDEHDH